MTANPPITAAARRDPRGELHFATMSAGEAERLLAGYRGCLYGFIRRKGFSAEEADDLVQETLVRAYLHLAAFRGTMLDAWLYRIAGNVCIDTRRRRRVPTVSLDLMVTAESADEPVDSRLLREERHERILAAIQDLPDCHRRILRLRYFEDRSLAEIAAVVNCSPMAAKLRVFRAVSALRRRWTVMESDCPM